jgi:hypothetical protein
MASYRRWVSVASACALCLACGGSEFTVAATGGVDAGSDGTGGSGDGAADTGPIVVADGATPVDAPSAACPNITGVYTVVIVDAAGCGDLSAAAGQCIQQDTQGCAITFMSMGSSNTAAINGDATLQGRSFMGAQLKEGTADRSGCTGVWDGVTSTLTVDCGGAGTTQSCVVSLRRTGARC